MVNLFAGQSVRPLVALTHEKYRAVLQIVAVELIVAWSLLRQSIVLVAALLTVYFNTQALADPAPNAASFSQLVAGTIVTTVPDGTCAAVMKVTGASGGSAPAAAVTGGLGGTGAAINATFKVLPLQAVTGAVGY